VGGQIRQKLSEYDTKGDKKMTARKSENSRQIPEPEERLSVVGMPLNVLFFPEEYEKLRKLAFENRTNLSEMVRRLVRNAEVTET
jgi:hypothetical protein